MKIEFTQGVLAGAEFPLRGPSVVVGRGVEVDLQILDERISRRHAELTVADGVATITDLDSHNGTYVNGVRIRHTQVLQPGDEVVIGGSAFVLRPGEARAAAAPLTEEGPVEWAQPAATTAKRRSLLPLAAVVAVLALAGAAAAFLLLRPGAPAATPTSVALLAPSGTALSTAATAISSPTAATATTAATAATAGPTPAPAPTAAATLPLVVLPLTPTPLPIILPSATLQPTLTAVPTAVPLPPTSRPTVPAPAYTVSWSPGTYDPWEGGHRLRTDLTITNVTLPQLSPPYSPAFIVAAADGSLRSGDLHDYSSPTNQLPTLLPGQSVTWTWYTIMPVTDRVVGSAFRYGDLTWTQQFNQDGSLAGPARPTSDRELAPLIPTVLPSGVAPDQLATVLPGILPTVLPTIFPSGVPQSGQ
ncbi:MAG: FHA domain-containing protein [Anaerolineae bacterium]